MRQAAPSHRIGLADLTAGRIWSAGMRRIEDLPQAMAWHLSGRAKANRKRLRNFKDLHEGARCFIIANGPSLARTDLRPLKAETTFGMNRIYLNFKEMGFQTSYYLAINELVLNQFAGEIAYLGMPKFLNWNQRKRFREVNDLNYLRLKLGFHDTFISDISRPLCSGGTVTFAALQVAFYMGFQQVVLVGLDHRFASKGRPNEVQVRAEARDQNHFHPNYFPAGSRWQLPDLRRSELAYGLARRAYEAEGRIILDATVDGACPVFEKVTYESLFNVSYDGG